MRSEALEHLEVGRRQRSQQRQPRSRQKKCKQNPGNRTPRKPSEDNVAKREEKAAVLEVLTGEIKPGFEKCFLNFARCWPLVNLERTTFMQCGGFMPSWRGTKNGREKRIHNSNLNQ